MSIEQHDTQSESSEGNVAYTTIAECPKGGPHEYGVKTDSCSKCGWDGGPPPTEEQHPEPKWEGNEDWQEYHRDHCDRSFYGINRCQCGLTEVIHTLLHQSHEAGVREEREGAMDAAKRLLDDLITYCGPNVMEAAALKSLVENVFPLTPENQRKEDA